MPVFTESSSSSSTIAEHIKLRRSRNHFYHNQQQGEIPTILTETDPTPHISRSSKSTISSLFLSPFSTNTTETTSKKKTTPFRGLGCTAGAAQQVSVPAVIRSSAEWEGKRVKKKKSQQQQKRKKESIRVFSESNNNNGEGNSSNNNNGGNVSSDNGNGSFNSGSCMVIQDVWCGPGIGFSADAVVGSVDCVVARRNNASGRGKIDGEKINQRERERERERAFCLGRRATVNPETLSFLDTDPAFVSSRPEPEVFGSRYYRHVRHPSPDGLAEIMLLQNSFMMGGRVDRFHEWRLDIDDMSYEQLLELGDRIGYVSTGLKDDEIGRCVRKIKLSIINELSSQLPLIPDKKCSICQEDYELDDELGKLDCGHGFHIQCIKQWLAQKKMCPVCKTEPVA
ncbi:hypothetical protein JCGZ_10712 [Jatropha curcas]|uniref:RING-type E3 ubiquitin transferase n=1 Tax=Jatropha curcas TaxID=180498 RepID=A0A067KJK9_JATCU|nr:uncharacterized protein LOC105636713 [Jatropha curcas]XP_012075443.1 uncharacterized protein LOC105636713 [Jatropha curcas]XP_012075444.1 uncharacterized protein LOC105636713 [Jatropha curcas]KDP35178.1 hypothetical protein JCGZ_10712 [Jatropha curcas]